MEVEFNTSWIGFYEQIIPQDFDAGASLKAKF